MRFGPSYLAVRRLIPNPSLRERLSDRTRNAQENNRLNSFAFFLLVYSQGPTGVPGPKGNQVSEADLPPGITLQSAEAFKPYLDSVACFSFFPMQTFWSRHQQNPLWSRFSCVGERWSLF